MQKLITKKTSFNKPAVELLQFFKDEPYVFLLESSQMETSMGRYSFLSFDPFEVIEGKGSESFDFLKAQYNKYFDPLLKTEWPLSTGIVGFLGYDYGLGLEKIVLQDRTSCDVPECCFGFYDFLIVVDHQTNELIVISSGLPELENVKQRQYAEERLNLIWKRIDAFDSLTLDKNLSAERGDLSIKSNFTKNDYEATINKVLEYIAAGDIYQVNLSQRFSVDLKEDDVDPVLLYAKLRELSPSCFGAYFKGSGYSIVSSSPERFLSLRGNEVQTRPMKGTRPRGDNELSDEKNKIEIMESPKERAELLMITDLHRNDIGRVCEYGSVSVKELRTLEEYKTVFQTTATIKGQLRKECDAFDLIENCFPGGSVTGCPKIRSMEIIEELEPDRRGIYTGSLGYIDFSGDMDFNVLIRTLLYKPDEITFHVGGGIVSDSEADLEYEETLVKARAILKSLKAVAVKRKASGE